MTYIKCMYDNSCGKEFNDLVEGTRYSSVAMGNLLFCSDSCCKNYLLNTIENRLKYESIAT
jgi:hypothetical protein